MKRSFSPRLYTVVSSHSKSSDEILCSMGMTAFYSKSGPPMSDEEWETHCMDTIGKALDMGVNLFDTAWIYQDFKTGATNEALLGKAIKKFGRDKFIICTKFGITLTLGSSGKPELIREQLADSLQRLDTDYVDLYYMHRMDPSTPIEETMQTLKELKDEGKIKYVGLSECSSSEMRRAHAVMPLSAIQMEWSLQTRDLEAQIVPTARELGIGIVSYSPLNRGFLSQTFTKLEDLPAEDWRRGNPRHQGPVMMPPSLPSRGKCVARLVALSPILLHRQVQCETPRL